MLNETEEQAHAMQKLESLGVLASGIAHDFSNLVAGIQAQSELLMEELRKGSVAWETASRIDALATRASEIVRQLMIYAGHKSAEFEVLDLVVLVREMLQLVTVSISKGAELEVSLPETRCAIRGNATQLWQVILNLITNASDALGGKAGVVSVTLNEVRPEKEFLGIDPASLSSGNYVRLAVSDTGCGMTPEIQASMFDPFFTTKGAGRGLGLSAIERIVRSHFGRINVHSVPGQGSCIEILLPCATHSEDHSWGEAAI